MNPKVVVRPSKLTGWSRSSSIGSHNSSNSNNSSSSSVSAMPSPPSTEMCALMRFAYKLGSVVHNNDPSTDGRNSDVRREAKLLMSLSCSSPVHMEDDGADDNINDSDGRQTDGDRTLTGSSWSLSSSSSTASTGRITPTSSISSVSSTGSRRDTFSFTCPSLSLENTRGNTGGTSPGIMLSRTLKVDDKEVLRLSSEAMARNVIESFQKALMWRIQSWVDSLSRVLVIKEMELIKTINSKRTTKEMQQQLRHDLYFCNEALLVKALRDIERKVQVLEATTAFKVLNKVSQVDETGSALKKRRTGELEDRTGLEEGEYVYNVIHVLEMQCSLNISTPAGNIRIDQNVPGKVVGSFFSSEDDHIENKLTEVTIDLNTEMMASMIEKSSRIAVRVSTEALLKGDDQVSNPDTTADAPKVPQDNILPTFEPATTAPVPISHLPRRSPKRKVDGSNVSGLVVVTPARDASSSRSSFGNDRDLNQPVLLQIPNSFQSRKQFGKILQPKASRAGTAATPGLDFAACLPSMKYTRPRKGLVTAVVTPLKTNGPLFIERQKGPNLPILMEAAGIQYMKKK